LAWLDKNRPNWRSLSAGSPQDYSIDGDVLTVVPKPITAVTDGFWLYYGKQAPIMTAPEHYPFSGSTTELTHLSMFDMSIVYYAKWKIEPILSKENSEDLTEMNYKKEREEKFTLFKRRRDVSASDAAKFAGPTVR